MPQCDSWLYLSCERSKVMNMSGVTRLKRYFLGGATHFGTQGFPGLIGVGIQGMPKDIQMDMRSYILSDSNIIQTGNCQQVFGSQNQCGTFEWTCHKVYFQFPHSVSFELDLNCCLFSRFLERSSLSKNDGLDIWMMHFTWSTQAQLEKSHG